MNDKIQANLNAQVEAAQLNHCKVLLCEDDYCSAEIVTFFLKEIRRLFIHILKGLSKLANQISGVLIRQLVQFVVQYLFSYPDHHLIG
jgi:hypothetical protein